MPTSLIEIPGYVTGTWTVDPAHSDVGFAIRHLMISNVKGHFTRFEGQIVTADDPLKSEVTATIDTASISQWRRIARGEGPDRPGDRGRPAGKALARLMGVHNRYGHTAGGSEAKKH